MSWWRTKVKRRKAFLGGRAGPLAAMPDSCRWPRAYWRRDHGEISAFHPRRSAGFRPGLAGRPENEEDDGSMAQQKSEDRVVPEGGCNAR